MDERQVALYGLVEYEGMEPDKAQALVGRFPELVDGMAAKFLPQMEAEARVQADREFAASPEGRRAAAKEAAKTLEARQEELAEARALLTVEGKDVEGFTETELLHHAGFQWSREAASVEQIDRRAEQHLTNWDGMTDRQRLDALAEVGGSWESFDSLSGTSRPTFSAGDGGGGDGGGEGGDS